MKTNQAMARPFMGCEIRQEHKTKMDKKEYLTDMARALDAYFTHENWSEQWEDDVIEIVFDHISKCDDLKTLQDDMVNYFVKDEKEN